MKCLWCDWPAVYWHESEMADGKNYACRTHVPNEQWMRIDPEDQIDTTEYINIRIAKVKYHGKYTHWDVDVTSHPLTVSMGGTAPTLWGVLDMVTEDIYDTAKNEKWLQFDANEPSRDWHAK